MTLFIYVKDGIKLANNEKIIDKIVGRILAYVQKGIEKAPFDKTFRAQVTESLGNGKYKVRYKGIEYTAKYSSTIAVNTWVYVCAPQNNWNELFIYNL